MGLFENVFGKKKQVKTSQYYQMLNGYTPVYTSFNGSVYEMMQTKAIINAIATDCGKAMPEIRGHNERFEFMLKHRPNPFMSTSAFIRRVVTSLLCDNNAFIVPMFDKYNRVVGLYPLAFSQVEAVEYNNEMYVRFKFDNGQVGCVEYSKVGHLRRMQYKNDLFGDNNGALRNTLEVLHSQNETIEEALKNSGAVRFMGKLNDVLISEEDFEEERKLFKNNLAKSNGEFLVYDSRYESIQQVESKPEYLDEKQQRLIDDNLNKYFGVSDKVINHSFSNDYEWNSYYEGVVEPILIELGEELTKILYTNAQIMSGQAVYITANRLQYMDNQTKLNFATQLRDRGIINGNQACDILNLPHYEGGEIYYIRKEYADVNELSKNEIVQDEEEVQNIESQTIEEEQGGVIDED